MESVLDRKREALLGRLRRNFDVEEKSGVFDAAADYHFRGERYVLSRRVKLWAAETHEYMFISTLPVLTTAGFERLRSEALRAGLVRVRPHREHMCSHITLVIIAGRAEPEAERAVKAARFYRSFRLALHGWCDLRTALLEADTGKISHNRAGAELRALLAPL